MGVGLEPTVSYLIVTPGTSTPGRRIFAEQIPELISFEFSKTAGFSQTESLTTSFVKDTFLSNTEY